MHAMAWVTWLGTVLVALSATRNPLHLLTILLCLAIVDVSVRAHEDASYSPISPLQFAAVVIPLSGLFNALTVHFGDTVLFRLPDTLPVIGGAITLEALVFGMINGLVLTGILTAFATLNRALPIRSLLRLIPRAFHPVAVVISIAITFVPVTLRQFQQIREAQAIRGHRLRGLRDWVSLFLPLLVGGLERAFRLAEAITARGFAAADSAAPGGMVRLSIVGGLAALLVGWMLRLMNVLALLGLALMLTGAGAILMPIWVLGRRVPHTRYRQEQWTGPDWDVVAGAAVVLAAFVAPGLDRSALFYQPYPALQMPPFDPLVGLATLGLLVPAFVNPKRLSSHRRDAKD
jgi:energy-coupling factor transport system permease protein